MTLEEQLKELIGMVNSSRARLRTAASTFTGGVVVSPCWVAQLFGPQRTSTVEGVGSLRRITLGADPKELFGRLVD